MWTYHQSTGELFTADGERIGVGYAGHGEGKNNPALQQVHDVGPLPRGKWLIGPAYTHPHLGPLTMNLTPMDGTQTFDRTDFRLHGESAKTPGGSSLGCMVQPHVVREAVDQSRDKELEVVA